TADVDFRRTTSVSVPVSTQNIRRAVLVVLGLMVIGFLSFLGYRILRKTPPAPRRFQRMNVAKLTTNGNSTYAAISRDGRYVAYVTNEAGQQSLWLRQVAVESNVRILPAREGNYLGVAFSPDGNFIYYGYVEEKHRPELYKVPVLAMGATATRVSLYSGPQS